MDFQRCLSSKIGSFRYVGVGGRENPQLPKTELKKQWAELSFPMRGAVGQGGQENPFVKHFQRFNPVNTRAPPELQGGG